MRRSKRSSDGKYLVKQSTRKKIGRLPLGKHGVIMLAIILLFIGVTGGTIAWLSAQSGPVENNFRFAQVSCKIDETFKDNVKSNVKIENTGNTDVYIRARIVVTWQDDEGNVFGQVPQAGSDYTISLNETGWLVGRDGYYYCTNAVTSDAPDNVTPVLITECKPVDNKAPKGYFLNVEILADAIQSTPAEAAWESWGVTIDDDGTITGK